MKFQITVLLVVFTTLCNAQIISIPDSNFKTKLLGADTSNTIAKNLGGNYFKIDSNNDGEIQQSEANEVSELYLNLPLNGTNYYISSAVGVTDFINLRKLDLKNNRIVNLNITGMLSLSDLDCSNNGQYLTTLIIENLPNLSRLSCQSAGSNTSTPIYSLSNLPVLKYINFASCRFFANTLDNITSLEEIYGYGGFKSTVTNIDLSNKPNLKIIELDNNNFSNITFLPNNTIETLRVSGSDLTSFDKTLFRNLKIIDLSWNRLNGLDVSNMASLLELNCDNGSTSSSYDFTTLNVQGCTNLTKLICSRNVISNLNLTDLTNLIYLDCYGNNDIFTHTGLQTISLQNCYNLKTVIANGNPYITELDLSCSSNYSQIRVQQCDNLRRINLKNGANESSMYSGLFSYYSCPNLNLVCVDFNENFSFLPSTIQQSPYYNFTPNCKYNTVLGNVKFDIEGDGCQNNNGISGIKILYNCSSPECYTFSNSNGNFVLYTQSNSITVTPVNEIFSLFDFGLTGPVTINFPPNDILENIDFCLAPNGIHNDLEVSIVPLNIPRPGFDSHYKIIYKNKGNQTQSGALTFTFNDAIMDLSMSNPSVSSSSPNTLQWTFTNFQPFETKEINLTFNINSPTETPAVNSGEILNFTASITNNSDINPSDNISNLNETVVNSFDPNNKICIEGATVPPTIAGQYVHYIINFENNGTANARNIVVRDIIDTSKFDISSLYPISSSHNVYSRVTNINEAEFIFENINLPFDNANNDGYIAFKIKTKPTLTVGNSFSNNASIYFDYNYPIITNTFLSTIQSLSTVENIKNDKILVYPNPVKDIIFFDTSEKVTKTEIFDITGRILKSNFATNNTLNLNELKSGNYILKIYTENGITSSKIIKE